MGRPSAASTISADPRKTSGEVGVGVDVGRSDCS